MRNQLGYYKLLVFSLLAIVAFTASCKKFLDKKSSNAITTPTGIADLQALLDDATAIMNQGGTPAFSEASANDYILMPGMYERYPPWEQHAYKWKPYNYIYPNDWSYSYAPIYNANYCLEILDKISPGLLDKTAWENVKGSALFFRSYYFLGLLWTFAKTFDEATAASDPGIVLRLSSDYNEPSYRSSVQDCYRRVITDANEAVEYLPDLPSHPFRPSKAAAYGLLARTYLSMRNYDSAYIYADACLAIKNDLIDLNGDEDLLGLNASFPFKQFNKETIFYTEMCATGTYGLMIPSRSYIDTLLYKSYDTNDLRKQAYFRNSNGYNVYKGSYSQGGRLFTGIATDELYLVRAEAAARKAQPDLPAALQDLNTLLSHRYSKAAFIPETINSPGLLIQKIQDERRKELLYRGVRWSDIKRFNKEGANIILRRTVNGETFQLLPGDPYYALPLPFDIISTTGIVQNPY